MFYLKLYNGRHDPEQTMEDFGFAGPEIGPLKSIHGTYTTHFMLSFVDEADAVKFGVDPNFLAIRFHEDMLCHQMPGESLAYYGDWTVYLEAGRTWQIANKGGSLIGKVADDAKHAMLGRTG